MHTTLLSPDLSPETRRLADTATPLEPRYVLVTPVRNEEKTIGITLESVVKQTRRPVEWVVVSDGSTDGTDAIIQRFANEHAFIRLLRLDKRPDRSFSSVVFATEAGIAHLSDRSHDFIGLLDADVRFGETYFEELLQRFADDSRLGLAGGLVIDCVDGKRIRIKQTLHDVAGAVQFFRRSCFESLGGLVALPEGGWDAITCLQARMHGFRTRTFPELEVDHLKPRNISEGNVPRRNFYLGVRDHALGNNALFEILKCSYRALGRPFLVGGMARLGGYLWCCIVGRPRALSGELVAHIRREQLARLLPFSLLRIRSAGRYGAAAETVDVKR